MSLAVVAAFGLALGSFLNVCIFRLPRDESVVSPRSRCLHCGRPIRWYDNVPLLSYFILRGRCRDCHERISPIYPAVEFLTGAILMATFVRYSLTPEFVKTSTLAMLLIVLIFTDLTERRIPHRATVLGIGLGLLLSFVVPVDDRPIGWLFRRAGVFLEGTVSSVVGALAGGLFGAGFFYMTREVFYRLRHKEGLGFGDVMLMWMIGTFLGVPLTFLTILLGSLLGTLVAGPLHLASMRFRDVEWPYGSFLGIAGLYSALGGRALIDAYLRWSGFG